MTTDRSYRKAMPLDVAIAELRRCSGTQFDPRVVTTLVAVLEDDAVARVETAAPSTMLLLPSSRRPDARARGGHARARRILARHFVDAADTGAVVRA